jgi:hypothetical protein
MCGLRRRLTVSPNFEFAGTIYTIQGDILVARGDPLGKPLQEVGNTISTTASVIETIGPSALNKAICDGDVAPYVAALVKCQLRGRAKAAGISAAQDPEAALKNAQAALESLKLLASLSGPEWGQWGEQPARPGARVFRRQA